MTKLHWLDILIWLVQEGIFDAIIGGSWRLHLIGLDCLDELWGHSIRLLFFLIKYQLALVIVDGCLIALNGDQTTIFTAWAKLLATWRHTGYIFRLLIPITFRWESKATELEWLHLFLLFLDHQVNCECLSFHLWGVRVHWCIHHGLRVVVNITCPRPSRTITLLTVHLYCHLV